MISEINVRFLIVSLFAVFLLLGCGEGQANSINKVCEYVANKANNQSLDGMAIKEGFVDVDNDGVPEKLVYKSGNPHGGSYYVLGDDGEYVLSTPQNAFLTKGSFIEYENKNYALYYTNDMPAEIYEYQKDGRGNLEAYKIKERCSITSIKLPEIQSDIDLGDKRICEQVLEYRFDEHPVLIDEVESWNWQQWPAIARRSKNMTTLDIDGDGGDEVLYRLSLISKNPTKFCSKEQIYIYEPDFQITTGQNTALQKLYDEHSCLDQLKIVSVKDTPENYILITGKPQKLEELDVYQLDESSVQQVCKVKFTHHYYSIHNTKGDF